MLNVQAQTVLEGKGRFTATDPVKIRVWVDAGAAPAAVVLQIPALNVRPLKTEGDKTSLAESDSPLTRLLSAASAQNIAHAMLDFPSDNPTTLPNTWRTNPDHFKDIDTAIELLRKRFPQAKILLGAYANNALSLLGYADRGGNLSDGLIFVSPNLALARNYQLSSPTKALMISVASARCYVTSFVDTQELVQRTMWNLLQVDYKSWGNRGVCGSNSQAGLVNKIPEVSAEMGQWILGQAYAASVGAEKSGIAGQEEVRMLKGSRGMVEVTIYRPPGNGPFPLLIWNHGDVEFGSATLKGSRYREPLMAHEFVDMGLAVAVVARPGIGRSDGRYAMGFQAGDGDATYKGRIHAKEMLEVWPQLQQLPWVDSQKLIVAGQSAGGFASVVATTLKIPELKAAITFSGGRTDMTSNGFASHENDMMIRGFRESGQNSNAPLMMVFAENDSRYTANTIRESYKAFVSAGGKATLSLYPPRQGDGHHMYHEPNLWREDVRKFLQEAGLPVIAVK